MPPSQTANLTWVSDGLLPLAGCRKLQILSIHGVKLKDQDWRHLSKITSLTNLDLAQTGCSDVGLQARYNVKSLQKIDLTGTAIMQAGPDQLKKNFPIAKLNGVSNLLVTKLFD